MRRLLTHMAAAEPHRYVVVDADGPADEVAERVAAGLAPLLPPAPAAEATVPTPLPRPSADPATVGIAAGGSRVHRLRPYLLRTGPPAGIGGRHRSHPPSGAAPRHALDRRHRPDRRPPTRAARSRAARPPPPNSPKAAP